MNLQETYRARSVRFLELGTCGDWRERLAHVTPTGVAACAWDPAVIAFERRAWLVTVLAARTPDVARYPERRFDSVL